MAVGWNYASFSKSDKINHAAARTRALHDSVSTYSFHHPPTYLLRSILPSIRGRRKPASRLSPTGNQRKMHYHANNSFPSSTTLQPPSFFFIVTSYPPAPFPSSFFLRTHMFAERTHHFRASSFRFLLIVKPIGWDKKEMIRGNERIGDVDQERERFHRRKYTIYVQIYIISHTYHG